MHDEFHRFLELPWELREDIWRLAIRPAYPGVHVFTIYNSRFDKDASLNEIQDIVTTHEGYPKTRLAAPRWGSRAIGDTFNSREHTASWTCNNPSTYLIDAGLWTACKESRFIIERAFNSQSWFSDFRSCCDDLHVLCEGKELAREMACFKETDPSKRCYFTVFSKQDLFYLQPHDLETLDWSGTFDCPNLDWLDWPGFRSMSHVAIDYDVTWAIELVNNDYLNTAMLDTLAHMAVDAGTDGSVEFLWLIDYGMERVSKDPDEDLDKVAVFRQGDRRFVDVDQYRPGVWYDPHGAEVHDGRKTTSSFYFVDRLNELIDCWTHMEHYEPTGDTPARWGVLACEHC
ncbi:hypothetical protein EDB81DRAFT_945720 [Dactylonectria macrodidyma]|uniref:2EXR domain-containing protein n=1 Tax=Dactylonectria macrodidyma TaxID=307937 RepID=A0A9P9F4F2_9HYPO|nr:hypothetical protein EDB81DRAFT_945720 [Dactylonectria macrodidyma]